MKCFRNERRGKKESRLGDDLRRAGNARDRGSNLLKVCLIMNRSERGGEGGEKGWTDGALLFSDFSISRMNR